ncbi:MAG: hypothetical protein HKN90_09470, partial [Flavobacteriaceae bacterium]|nr:hypothetical protein [Flavobacteriaceae bacterium]
MKKIKLIIGTFVLGGLMLNSSCVKDLSNDDKSWNPYIEDEILVFKSSENELDSIKISKIEDNAVSSGPTPELYRKTHLIVYGKKLKLKDSKFSTNSILEISSSTPEKPSEVNFTLGFYNSNFAGWGLKLDDLKKYPMISVKTQAGKFDDVIKIEPVLFQPERENA